MKKMVVLIILFFAILLLSDYYFMTLNVFKGVDAYLNLNERNHFNITETLIMVRNDTKETYISSIVTTYENEGIVFIKEDNMYKSDEIIIEIHERNLFEKEYVLIEFKVL